ncbi:hypothetical protein [Actinopolyspora mortivallis]|uniref:Uncharacterized protein n=1 Tax=Actinopolyspora mortivallis TaxID=33906 RepID=A0A2T0GRR3_ACTMO|nr:hypothetical protein [Actinopolyspora mortivallis]PRW61812.1 hypothetical protein CEP50_18740 [Actinopolyspora mortivallis]
MISVREVRDRAVIRPVKRAVEDQLLDIPGVVAVDIGEKRTAGRTTGQQSIVVSVERKEPVELLGESHRVPDHVLGIPTDVVEETVTLHHAHYRLDDPVPPLAPVESATVFGGVGISPRRPVTVEPGRAESTGDCHRIGTLGTLVFGYGSTVLTMGLTTFDVACMDDAWSVGDAMLDPQSGREYADLSRAALSGKVDAAAVALAGSLDRCCLIPGIGSVTGQGSAEPGEFVRKSGFGTGLTSATVTSTDATVRLDHGPALGVRVLREQLRVTSSDDQPFVGEGDAGAVLVNGDGRVVGLHLAGSRDGTVGYACPIADVLAELDLELAVTFRRLRAQDEYVR